MSADRAVCLSLAAFPGLEHLRAVFTAHGRAAAGSLCEPALGPLSLEHVQLVPQSRGVLTEDLAQSLREAYPQTSWRLHANVRVLPNHVLADLSNMDRFSNWWQQAARVHRALGASAYSAHAGWRKNADFAQMLANTKRAEEILGCRVAVEGGYPSAQEDWIVGSWSDYARLLDSGAAFALDLSHLNIVARSSGQRETTLVSEMLASENCLEVHVSTNDGKADTHRTCECDQWWSELLPKAHRNAVLFSEGNHLKPPPSGGTY